MSDTLAALREEWDRMDAPPVPYRSLIARLFARAEAAERERDEFSEHLRDISRIAQEEQARIAALEAGLRKMETTARIWSRLESEHGGGIDYAGIEWADFQQALSRAAAVLASVSDAEERDP